jgi:carbon storage regulator
MLILTRRVGEALMVGENTKIVVLGVKGSQIRLGIDAPKDIMVHREEIFIKIQEEKNQEASNDEIITQK